MIYVSKIDARDSEGSPVKGRSSGANSLDELEKSGLQTALYSHKLKFLEEQRVPRKLRRNAEKGHSPKSKIDNTSTLVNPGGDGNSRLLHENDLRWAR